MNHPRQYWLRQLQSLADPVLTALNRRELRKTMPLESIIDRSDCSCLEAFGRLLCGLAPWLELAPDDSEEGVLRRRCQQATLAAIEAAVDPASPDYLWATPDNQHPNPQLLVDTAFFAQGLLRAPRQILGEMSPALRRMTAEMLCRSRVITPGPNNWLLFSAMVEAALLKMGFPADLTRIAYALRQHDQWFKGDGIYGDGCNFAFDYYNSYVIQPMLLDITALIADRGEEWEMLHRKVLRRIRRYAVIQERLIAPDGSFPAVGRSLAYRCGAFHALSTVALHRELPEELHPAAVREALTAVIARTLEAPGTRDSNGWLQIGLCGHQPAIGEGYISTGSLYLASTAFLPLGLPAEDPFWSDPAEPWSAVKIWSGCDLPADHAVQDL